MKKITALSAILLTATMFACGPKGPQTVKGMIVDASMNVISITNETGDTLTFSTTDAAIEAQDGILLGDSVEITYNAPMSTEANILTPATKITSTFAPRTPSIVGKWIQPIPGMDGIQGIEFVADSTASSINMATLVYKSWSIDGDTLRMNGQSIGNGQTIDFNQAATFQMPTPDSLVITTNGNSESFSRQK